MVGKEDEPKNLAITILFGDRFVDDANPQLLAALHRSPGEIGELLMASWSTEGTAGGFAARATG